MKPTFWKLLQGAEKSRHDEIIDSIHTQLVYVHKTASRKTKSLNSQTEDFINAEIGDYFYLCHGNQRIYLLGQFTGPVNLFSEYGQGWLDRPFRFIRSSISNKVFKEKQRRWTPNDASTFIKVPEDQIDDFAKKGQIYFSPFFLGLPCFRLSILPVNCPRCKAPLINANSALGIPSSTNMPYASL